MRLYSLVIGLLVVVSSVFGQKTPQVQSKMQFANLQLSINKSARHKIQKEVDKLHRSKSYFKKYVENANLHFPIIEQAFREEGCPTDIKYLIIQESGINATAVSSSNAVGYWQFKKATGQEVGLKIAKGIDERKSIYASSHGAGIYMFKNNKRINNWIYTIMAYNTGVGGAQKYIKSKYRGVKKMDVNSHTHWYVIKFLAHKIAFEQAVGKVPHNQKLLTIEAKSGQSVKQLAKKYKVSAESAKSYNEWIGFSKRIPSDKKYVVIFSVKNDGSEEPIEPIDSQEEVLTQNESANTPGTPIAYHSVSLSTKIPQVSKLITINRRPAVIPTTGESVASLARKGGVSQKKFRKYNELKSFEEVIAGVPYFFKRKRAKSKTLYHTVEAGETTWSISQKYGIKEWSLRTKNRIKKRESLLLGRELWLRKTRPDKTPIKFNKVKRVIKPTVPQPKAEEVKEPKKVIGKEVIPVVAKEIEEEVIEKPTVLPDSVPTEKPVLEMMDYTVKQGETMYSISRKFQVSVADLLKWNNKTDNSLDIGQVIKIKK